jgi:hypothetical protein
VASCFPLEAIFCLEAYQRHSVNKLLSFCSQSHIHHSFAVIAYYHYELAQTLSR